MNKFQKTDVCMVMNIRCRRCKKNHEFENKIPLEFVCACGKVIAKGGFIYPKKEKNK